MASHSALLQRLIADPRVRELAAKKAPTARQGADFGRAGLASTDITADELRALGYDDLEPDWRLQVAVENGVPIFNRTESKTGLDVAPRLLDPSSKWNSLPYLAAAAPVAALAAPAIASAVAPSASAAPSVAGIAPTVAPATSSVSSWLTPALKYGLGPATTLAGGIIASKSNTAAAKLEAELSNRALDDARAQRDIENARYERETAYNHEQTAEQIARQQEVQGYNRQQYADFAQSLAPYRANGVTASDRLSALLRNGRNG